MGQSRFYFVSVSLWTLAIPVFGADCQITSPLPVPITIAGCSFSGSLPNNSTSYIQNTLSPTTTTQLYSVQKATITDSATLTYLAGTQCLQSDSTGKITGTGSACGSGAGGGGSGTINAANQFSAPYYFVAGSSNVLSGFPGMTMSTNTGVNISTLTVTSTSTLSYVTISSFTASSATATNLSVAYNVTAGSANINNLSNLVFPIPDSSHQLNDSALSQSSGRILVLSNNGADTVTEIKATNNGGSGIASIQLLGSAGDFFIPGSGSGDAIYGATGNAYIERSYPTGGAAASFLSGSTVLRDATTFKSSMTVNGETLLKSTMTLTYSTVVINGVQMAWPSSGTTSGFLQYISSNTLQWATPALAGSGIVSPGTFTWVNTQGISVSTLTVSTGIIVGDSTHSPEIITSTNSLTLRQTGDVFGPTYLILENRFGANGAVFGSSALDLIDFAFLPSVGPQANVRFEHRPGNLQSSGNGFGEFQYLFDSTTTVVVPLSIGTDTVRISSLHTQINNGDLVILDSSTATALKVSSVSTGVALFSVSSSPAVNQADFLFTASSTSGTMALGIQNNSHVISSGTTPSVSSCGSTPNGSVVGTDMAGVITVGGGSVTACTLTFSSPYANAPVCLQSDNSTALTADITSISTTQVVFGFSASIGGGTVWYICIGNRG